MLCERYLDDINELINVEFGIEMQFLSKLFLDVKSNEHALVVDFVRREIYFKLAEKPHTFVDDKKISTTYDYYKSVILMLTSDFCWHPFISEILRSFQQWGAFTVGLYTTFIKLEDDDDVNEYSLDLHSSCLAAIFKKVELYDDIYLNNSIVINMLDGKFYVDSHSTIDKLENVRN